MKFYARPHALWRKHEDGSPVLIAGMLQAELDSNGNAVVANYTLAIGSGKPETKLSSAPPMPWLGFKTKREAQNFMDDYNAQAAKGFVLP